MAAGTITLGLGAAMAGGTAVAYADTGSSASHSTSDSSNSTAPKQDSGGSARKTVGKAAPRPATASLTTAPKSRASLSLVTDTSTAAKSKASATPTLPTPESVLSDIGRQINYIFFNKAPTASPTQDGQAGPKKQVDGAVNGVSNNGYKPTYTVTEQPKYGNVTLDPKTGEFSYVARDELVSPGITDEFTVTISNGAAAKLPGILGQLQMALHSMAVALGVAKTDTIEKDIVVKITGTGIYGTQAAQKQFWLEQTLDNDCVLIADAAIIAQLGGPQLTEAQIVQVGKTTTSTVDPTKPMYVGTKADTGSAGMYDADGVALLKKYGINATYKSYVDAPEPGEAPNKATQIDGQRALYDVEAALAAGKAVAVVVDAGLIVNASGADTETPAPEANHWVVVTGVDISTGKVYLNDGNLPAGSTPVSMAGFMWSWQSSDFGVIVAEKAPAPAAAIAA